MAGPRASFGDVPAERRLTLTWDQGSEMASHDLVADLFRDGVFFAHAGKPWQRPTNENSNGLLRQYFPKGADLRAYTAEDLRRVDERLNRGRRPLGLAARGSDASRSDLQRGTVRRRGSASRRRPRLGTTPRHDGAARDRRG